MDSFLLDVVVFPKLVVHPLQAGRMAHNDIIVLNVAGFAHNAEECSRRSLSFCAQVIEEMRSYVRRPAGRFEAIPDNIPPGDVHTQVHYPSSTLNKNQTSFDTVPNPARIRIQSGSRVLMTKNCKQFAVKKNLKNLF